MIKKKKNYISRDNRNTCIPIWDLYYQVKSKLNTMLVYIDF